MDYKDHIRSTVESLQKLTGKTQETIATEMGYGRTYISEVLSPTGKVSKKFLNALNAYARDVYSESLEIPKKRPAAIGSVPGYTSKVEEPTEGYNVDNRDRYTKLLEDNDRFFKRILETNLASIDQTQQAILAHVQAMVQMDAERQSGGNPEKLNKVLQEWGKLIAGSLAVQMQTGKGYTLKDKVS
jgi:transcriptional regulator with XRE-family HTH domain